MKTSLISACLWLLSSLSVTGCNDHQSEHGAAHRTRPIVATTPLIRDYIQTEEYVGQIHSRRHIEVRALERGYLEAIKVKEGQGVEKGDVLFKLLPTVYKAKLHADEAELQAADIALRNTKALFDENVVSDQELALARAEKAKAQAKVELAKAELSFTEIRAPFGGIIGRQYEQQGSLAEEGDVLTTISDNEVMWVYFNVPEADYLAFRAIPQEPGSSTSQTLALPDTTIELELADGTVFEHDAGNTVTLESTFDNETGNIQFRADFPNSENLLRHGQTGTLQIHRKLANAVVIPQRATFEILDKLYVYVIDKHGIAHQRRIKVAHETDDIFVLEGGLQVDETIVLEGVRQVHDGDHVEVQLRDPSETLAHLKHHAE